jgi:hypothetical protein
MRQNKKIDVDKIGRRGGKSCGGSEAKNELPPLGGPVCSVTLRQKGRAVPASFHYIGNRVTSSQLRCYSLHLIF